MKVLDERPSSPPPKPARRGHAGGLVGWVTTTDHKKIGILYMITAFAFFLLGGAMALVMRAELASSGRQLVGESVYNQLFTMHGSIMMFLFAVPMAFGFANYLVPLQIGAPDMAFPRLNAVSYWLFLGGGLTMVSGFATSRGAAAFGWTAYTPLGFVTARVVSGRASATRVDVQVSPRLVDRATRTLVSGSGRVGWRPLMPQYRVLLRPQAIGVSLR